MMRKRCSNIILFPMALSGILLAIWSHEIHHFILKKLLDLTPGGVLYLGWSQPYPVMIFDVYLFNWTNPQDFGDRLKKPEFAEIGPFRFYEQVEKTNVTYNDNNTISYILKKSYKFSGAESIHGLDLEIVMLNQMASAIAYKVKDLNYFVRKSASVSLTSFSSLYVKKTVGELLFDGYSDPILKAVSKLPIELPHYIKDKFGFLYKRNGSSDGLFNIGTGRGNYKLGALYKWNGEDSSTFYGESCRNISEISMDFYTDNLDDGKLKTLYPDLCRKATLDFVDKETFFGIESHRFEIDDSFLDNGTKIPGNECFCANQCMRYGLVPATLCQGEANHFLSLPHFLKADPYYASKIKGMAPDHGRHSFNLFVEPVTGIMLEMSARMQLNALVEPIPGITMLKDAPTALFPLFWVENAFKIPNYGAFGIRILINLRLIIASIGLMIFIMGILLYYLELRRARILKDNEIRYASKDIPLLNGNYPRDEEKQIVEEKQDLRKVKSK